MDVDNENKIVGLLSEATAKRCGVHPIVARRLRTAAVTHDIGKSKISKAILEKPDKLTNGELLDMKRHTTFGAEMLTSVQGEVGEMARTICLYHHEWYDGSRSYWGKLTDDLPLYVSIVSIADVYTALIFERPYKPAWPPLDALSYIRGNAGKQFNPALVEKFIPLVEPIENLYDIQRVCNVLRVRE